MSSKFNILFLCTGNSCRSQMAEGWVKHLKNDSINVHSAGIEIHGLNANAVFVMAEAGVDISNHKSTHVDEFKSNDLISYFYNLLQGNKKDSTNAMMSNDLRMNLCDDLLLYTDKISMNFSIEARVPMLDNDLVDFIESLPLKYKINGKRKTFCSVL